MPAAQFSPIPTVEIARFKRTLTYLKKAAADLEGIAVTYTCISTDEADKHATLAKNHLTKAIEFFEESLWLAESEGASAFAA